MTTDSEWQKWGIRDPYYAVLTNPKYRSGAITPEARTEFFRSGEITVDYVLNTCRRFLDPLFAPKRVLDFGCGVGRLSIPFAAQADEVVALDAAQSMLAQARLNCEERKCENVVLALSDDSLSEAPGHFDLVHSCIVLQHVELIRGRSIFSELIAKIKPGGCGSIQVPFAWDRYQENFGIIPPTAPIAQKRPLFGEVGDKFRKSLKMIGLFRDPNPTPSQGDTPLDDPEMQMNYYDLNQLMFILQKEGVTRVVSDITNHGGAIGAFMFFQKP